MGINLLTKYGDSIQKGFAADSYTLNKVATDWKFAGAKSIVMKSYVMEDSIESWPTIANRTQTGGGDRFGTVTDIEDVIQTLTLGKHTKWTKSIDLSDNAQGAQHVAGDYMRQHNNEIDMPKRDKHNLRQWALHAGKCITASAALSDSNIIGFVLDLETELDEKNVPQENRWVYCPVKYRKYIRMADEWVGADNLTRDMIVKGWEGSIGSLKFVFVPSIYMPANVEMLVCYQGSVIAPLVHKTARILDEVQGYDGPVLEYHDLYDAFVKGVKQDGVVALIKYGASAQAANPTIGNPATASGTTTVSLTSSGATVYYTLDGSDPRWSDTAKGVASGSNVDITAFTGTLRAYAKSETAGSEKYPSDVVSQGYTNGAKNT